MKSALLLHGTCEKEEFDTSGQTLSNSHWFPWMQQQLLRNDILCQTPEMPYPYAPEYEPWLECFKQFSAQNLEIIIGHSSGAGFILKYLQKNQLPQLKKLILIAPWLDPERENGDFLQTELHPEALEHIPEIHLFYSEDDDKNILQSTYDILTAYPQIKVHRFNDKGHFVKSTIGLTFPELWDVCKD